MDCALRLRRGSLHGTLRMATILPEHQRRFLDPRLGPSCREPGQCGISTCISVALCRPRDGLSLGCDHPLTPILVGDILRSEVPCFTHWQETGGHSPSVGLIAVLFGLFTFFLPGITLVTLVLLFGAYALVVGIVNVIAFIRVPRISGRSLLRV